MTKLHYLLTLLIACSLGVLHAVPAKNTPITVTEPDGSTLTIYLNGDEYFSWRTTNDGVPVIQQDGYYYYALYQADGEVSATTQRVVSNGMVVSPRSVVIEQDMQSIARTAMATRRAESRSVATKATIFPTDGTIKSVAILVEFQDVKFTTEDANQVFHDMLNLEGYSDNGATGSARDYFAANSGGAYIGEFDVYGVYTLDNDCAYYGGNNSYGGDSRPQQLAIDAVAKCDADGVDFSQYDYDNDGYIDNVFVYYAGYNEAEGGDDDTVWPHRYYVYDNTTYDGKVLYGYACSSELRSNSGTTVAGIGTFCHEFSHVLGLADHYDTNGSTNGTSAGLGAYDIMSSGNYNNSGCTPPMMNVLELEMIGWCTPTVVESAGEVTLEPLQYDGKKTLRIDTEVEGEYFLAECRHQDAIVWDNYIPGNGLIIYHVDRSAPYMTYWNNNEPNGSSSHECLKYVVASNQSTSYFRFTWDQVPYPYSTKNEWSASTSPRAESWGEVELNYQFADITRTGENEQCITLSIIEREPCAISGLITDGNTGEGVGEATVTLTSLTTDITYSAYTGSSGWYELGALPDGSYEVAIYADGYNMYTESIDVATGDTYNFEIGCYTNYLGYHNSTPTYGLTIEMWHKAYITLDESKLAGVVGSNITGVNIYLGSSFPGASVSIEPSNGTAMSVDVTKTISGSGWQLVDVSDFNLSVEEGITYDVAIIGESSWAFMVDNDTSGEYDGLSNMLLLDSNGNASTINSLTGGSCLGNILLELVVTSPNVADEESIGDVVFAITTDDDTSLEGTVITLTSLDATPIIYTTACDKQGYALLPRLPYDTYSLSVVFDETEVYTSTVEVDSDTQTCEVELSLSVLDNLMMKVAVSPRVYAANGVIYIANEAPIVQATITTLQGSQVRSIDNPLSSINVKGLSQGIYLVTITTTSGSYTYKVVL